MSQCCVIPHTGDTPTCPMNGQVLKSIGRITVESLVRPEIKSELLSQPYYFCNAWIVTRYMSQHWVIT